MHRAHRQGVVHRDLKPGNVMLTRSGAKLLDFGLARSTAPGLSATNLTAMPTSTSPLTGEGTAPGTVQYMAPEQLEGGQADTRSDIFAFGMLLYEMITGRRAFPGKNQASVIAAILKEQPPPISELVPVAPPGLERLVRTCLSKDPEDRRQSMKDVLIDLEWIDEAASEASPSQSVAKRRKPWVSWTLAALSTLLAAVLALVLMSRTGGEPSVIRALIPLPENTAFNLDMVTPGPVAVSPDGRRIVFAAREEDGPVRLWVRDLAALKATPVGGPKAEAIPSGRPTAGP